MFDVFVAEMRCPNCSTVVPTADASIQTHIRDDADGSSLGNGFVFDPRDLATEHILGAGYALVVAPTAGSPIRLLDVWICPECHTEQWAMVTIVDGRIQQMEPVTMNRAVLEAANFISDVNADLLAERYGPGNSSVET